jgi:hypothetical protein
LQVQCLLPHQDPPNLNPGFHRTPPQDLSASWR